MRAFGQKLRRKGSAWSGLARTPLMMFGAMLVLGALFTLTLVLDSSKAPAAWAGSSGSTPTPSIPDKATRITSPKLTPTFGVPSTPEPDGGYAGWERLALRDLAGVVAWPTAVTTDNVGRLLVQDYQSPELWRAAHIRAFDFPAGARAGFEAEQEDARIAGFTVSPEEFYNYAAYTAVLRDQSGTAVEMRFRWLAATWTLGVDVRGALDGPGAPDVRLIAEELLSIAVAYGLPSPPNTQPPTPNPTWGLPPASSPTVLPCSIIFSDVSTDYWAYAYIHGLACRGVLSGYSDGTFRPESPTTRAQFAKMLVLTQGWTLDNPNTPTFHDVQRTHPFFPYVETAAAHHVVSGYDDGNFRPDAHVSRAQVAKMLVRAEGWNDTPPGVVPLCDVSSDYWAWSYIQLAVEHGVFSGYGDNCFRPDLMATRAQLAKVLGVAGP